jgi:rhodanese-related sulfurtransferase
MKTIEPGDVAATDTILDVRHHVGPEQIRGAVRYNPKALLDAPELALPLNTEGRIVLVSDSEREAAEIAERLTTMGARDIWYLKDGIAGWRDAGLPTEEPTQEQPVPTEPKAGIHLL